MRVEKKAYRNFQRLNGHYMHLMRRKGPSKVYLNNWAEIDRNAVNKLRDAVRKKELHFFSLQAKTEKLGRKMLHDRYSLKKVKGTLPESAIENIEWDYGK